MQEQTSATGWGAFVGISISIRRNEVPGARGLEGCARECAGVHRCEGSYGSEKQGPERWVSPELLGGLAMGLRCFAGARKNDLCGGSSCLHPLWPGFFFFGLVVASLMRYRLLPQWFGVSPPPPDPHRQVGLEGGRRRAVGESRDGRLAELDHCQVGGEGTPTPPPPLGSISAVGAKG